MEFVKTTLRIESALHRRLKAEAALRGTSIEGALNEAATLWLGAPPAAAAPSPAGLGKEEAQQVSLFLDFLRNGEEGTVEMVRHALELYARKQRAQRKRSSA